ncbi:MAG: GNAT family N-acetyltransferase [Ginsengibacter sp.]
MTDKIDYRTLTKNEINDIAILAQQLNPTLTLEQIKTYLLQMFDFETYTCFGVFLNDKLVGISSAWTTVRIYSGKQLEVDNVVIDSSLQSKGIGRTFFEFIENWAKKNEYKTIELNTYVQNSKSHKFYYNLGYSILGFHFWKHI